MKKLKTSYEIEKDVLEYLDKKTSKGFTMDFNPLDVTLDEIASALNLNKKEINEALENLSGLGEAASKIKKIESLKPRFEIWLPINSEGAENIKQELCGSGMAIRGASNQFYSFLLIVLIYILKFQTQLLDFLDVGTLEQHFVFAAIVTAISFPIGNYLAHKWYNLTLILEKVRGAKYYYYTLIIITILFWLIVQKGWDKLFTTILIIAAICTIFGFILSYIKIDKKEKIK